MVDSLARRLSQRWTDNEISTTPESVATEQHAWERWGWMWHVAFYIFLTLSLVASLIDFGLAFGTTQIILAALSVMFGVWYWHMMIRSGWIDDTRTGMFYVATVVAIWFVLVVLHPAYHLLLFVLFAQIYSVLPIRFAIPGSVVLTAAIITRGILREPEGLMMWIGSGALSVLFGAFFGLWINSIVRQSVERQRLIDELKATREELAAEERRNGVLEERSRLAREIHDTLAQGFISIVTHLEAAEVGMSLSTGSSHHHVQQAKETARENLSEARRLVAALHPEMLENASLADALNRLASRFSEETGIQADVNITGEQHQLPQQVQVTLLRVAQEALANVRRHSQARAATLTLSYIDDLVLLDVNDDGVGFDPEIRGRELEGGFGLCAMRERVEELNGELLVESAPGEGTTIAVQLPLNSHAQVFHAAEPR